MLEKRTGMSEEKDLGGQGEEMIEEDRAGENRMDVEKGKGRQGQEMTVVDRDRRGDDRERVGQR